MRRAALLSLVLVFVACRSALDCSAPSGAARAPENFGVVLDVEGTPTPIYRGAQPRRCNELDYLHAIGVRTIVKLNGPDLEEEKQAVARGMEMYAFSFSARTIATSCDRVSGALAILMDPAKAPVYVHCTHGRDRTGYLIGLFERVALRKPTAQVLAELAQFGHRGLWSMLMPSIDRELARPSPACGRGQPQSGR